MAALQKLRILSSPKYIVLLYMLIRHLPEVQGRVQAAQRIQWPGIPGAFYTTHIGADITKDKLPLNFGLNYLRDQTGEGILTNQVFSLNVGRAIKLFKNLSLRIGASG